MPTSAAAAYAACPIRRAPRRRGHDARATPTPATLSHDLTWLRDVRRQRSLCSKHLAHLHDPFTHSSCLPRTRLQSLPDPARFLGP